MAKTSFSFITTGITLALTVAVLIPTHMVMAQFGAPTNAFGGGTVSTVSTLIIGLINTVFVPLIFALAFIVFIWGVFRYFIAGAEDTESQSKGKQLIFYGLIGFVIMVSVWGLVNVLNNTLGLSSSYVPPYPTIPLQ